MASDTTTIRVSREMHDLLAKLAKANHRSINGEATFALERHLKEFGPAVKPTEGEKL